MPNGKWQVGQRSLALSDVPLHDALASEYCMPLFAILHGYFPPSIWQAVH